MRMQIPRASVALGALFCLCLAVALLAYLPGLGGAFVVDDFANLDNLDLFRDGPFLDTFLRYVLNGFSSPLGRPLALATFAVQYPSWPLHAGDFIYVNVLLHLFNGCLLFAVFLRLLSLLPPSEAAPPKAIGGKTVELTTSNGGSTWTCQKGTIDTKYLPGACK